MLAATLLTEEEVILENVPDIKDVRTLMDLLRVLGAEAEWTGPNEVRVRAKDVGRRGSTRRRPPASAPPSSSPARCSPAPGEMHLPPPGGDVIGRRRMDTHFLALQRLGAEVDTTTSIFAPDARTACAAPTSSSTSRASPPPRTR
jgi:UDP-N-acetylglucosamine 1-carboxyvinyltransferase